MACGGERFVKSKHAMIAVSLTYEMFKVDFSLDTGGRDKNSRGVSNAPVVMPGLVPQCVTRRWLLEIRDCFLSHSGFLYMYEVIALDT